MAFVSHKFQAIWPRAPLPPLRALSCPKKGLYFLARNGSGARSSAFTRCSISRQFALMKFRALTRRYLNAAPAKFAPRGMTRVFAGRE